MTNVFVVSSFALAVALAAGPVSAQTAPKPEEQPSAQDAEQVLAEIIVTAQKRSQNLQEVPVAISVVSGDLLKQTGYRSLSDLSYLAPSVQYDPSNGGGFQIRGVGTQVFDYSTEQAVGVVIDDVVMDLPRSPGILGLTDIDRIEVLRGPQGTLFGKNASGGVISVVTKKPSTDKVEGDASVSYGERNDRNVSANLNLPLGASAALRISGFHQGQDGYGRYTFLNKDLGNVRETGVRAKLLLKPAEGLELLLTGDYARHRDNSPFTLVTASSVFEPALSNSGVVPGPNNVDNADPIESGNRYTVKGSSLVVNYEIGQHVLTSISAYRKFNSENDVPFDFVPSPLFLPFNHGTIDSEKFSQELRIASPKEQFLEYVLGLYYNDMKLHSTQEQTGQLGVPLPPNVYFSLSNGETLFDNKIQSKAAFGTATLNFSEQLVLVLGGRFTDDKNSASIAFQNVQRPYTYIPIGTVPASPSGSVSKSNFSYRVSPQFKIDRAQYALCNLCNGVQGSGCNILWRGS